MVMSASLRFFLALAPPARAELQLIFALRSRGASSLDMREEMSHLRERLVVAHVIPWALVERAVARVVRRLEKVHRDLQTEAVACGKISCLVPRAAGVGAGADGDILGL